MAERVFLLQMAGNPGTGKSALARLIGRRTGAVVIDKDVLKTAALASGLRDSLAGGVAYQVLFALADHVLGQGLAAILDSPSFYESIPVNGAAVAKARCVPYYFIVCICPDEHERGRRLRERLSLGSNPGEEAVTEAMPTVFPPGGHLQLDTTQPIDHCLLLALDYLGA